jgi:hypothetical protein
MLLTDLAANWYSSPGGQSPGAALTDVVPLRPVTGHAGDGG